MARDGITFATFNLLNFAAAGAPMYPGDAPWTGAQVAAKVEFTRSMLRRLSADVIGFQELWDLAPLESAFDAAGLGGDYDLIAPAPGGRRTIHCAAAVRKGLLAAEPEWIADFPPGFRLESGAAEDRAPAMSVGLSSFSRPVLHLQVQPRDSGAPVHVFVAHLKSKREEEVRDEPWFAAAPDLYRPHARALGQALATIRRTAEATALRVILTGLMKRTEVPVVVLGDLNDGQDSNTLAILTEQPTLLRPLALGGRDTALYAGQALQEAESLRDVYYTYIHDRVHGSLDHILVSQEFYSQSRRRIWSFDGLDVFNDHLNGPEGEKATGASDHGVVRARFGYRPQAPAGPAD